MTTTVKNFATPESIVRISNLKVNIKDFTFQLTLGTKAKKQRNFREEVITGKITVELNDWLSKTFKERIKVADDSEQGYKYQEIADELNLPLLKPDQSTYSPLDSSPWLHEYAVPFQAILID